MSRDNYIPVVTVHQTWDAMRQHLGLPSNSEAGMKLVRRSVSTIARLDIGEEYWVQGEIMLGHQKSTISDIYAIRDPANLGRALAATERIIDEIEKRVPGAFVAGNAARLRAVK
ncbi:hypothetical protein [Novosphingobium rosa]|uniref:hypothetical protein n=1 Tax=Novosphingobium rosa TaxID=76978 RepID=UPI0008339037|nr:hypothetical protein [Novosphingobium rosa]